MPDLPICFCCSPTPPVISFFYMDQGKASICAFTAVNLEFSKQPLGAETVENSRTNIHEPWPLQIYLRIKETPVVAVSSEPLAQYL